VANMGLAARPLRPDAQGQPHKGPAPSPETLCASHNYKQ